MSMRVLRICVTKMLQRDRHLGKLRHPEETVVRCQLRYLADVLAELRRQAGRGLINATGPLEHVSQELHPVQRACPARFRRAGACWGAT